MLWISTPEHGYLQVSKRTVKEYGFQPSCYSYQDKNDWFLEEDCDAPDFLKVMYPKEWTYVIKDIPESYQDSPSWRCA
jgi:hypothetical protein